MDVETQQEAEIGPGTRQLCEALADRVDAAAGRVKLEVFFTDGRVTKVRRTTDFSAAELAMFDASPVNAAASG